MTIVVEGPTRQPEQPRFRAAALAQRQRDRYHNLSTHLAVILRLKETKLALATRTTGDDLQRTDSLRWDIAALLRDKRYEEALALLYRARSEAPDDAQLEKSIEQVKAFLIGAYAKRLGGLDQIAAPVAKSLMRSADTVLVARYINGKSSMGDVAQICPLGQLRTLQVLVGLYCGAEPPRFDNDSPLSGIREPTPQSSEPEAPEEPAPDTARSSSSGSGTRTLERGEAQRYDHLFAVGTTAFVQRRYADAVEAFEECARLRPGDKAADVMVRRSLKGRGET